MCAEMGIGMADYHRLVSYIYAYADGVRDRNVGFAKAQVRQGKLSLAVSLKGVYTDAPERMGVYFMAFEADSGKWKLYPVGDVIVNQGLGSYQDIFYAQNINQLHLTFEDIGGIAVAKEEDSYYMMFSLWKDLEFSVKDVVFVKPETMTTAECAEETSKVKEQEENIEIVETTETQMTQKVLEQVAYADEEEESSDEEKELSNVADNWKQEISTAPGVTGEVLQAAEVKMDKETLQEMQMYDEEEVQMPQTMQWEQQSCKTDIKEKEEEIKERSIPQVMPFTAPADDKYEQLFVHATVLDIFDDDYYYDCIEVSPEQLRTLPLDDQAVVQNSFLVHGYCQFKHVLFGRVRENDNNTHYFIGVPGMYCNRERFMASMFGFNNFKKSHRSDYVNPYFGYWYQEI